MPTKSKQWIETCTCDVCGCPMFLLTDLPAVVKYEAVHVFRCYGCNAVKSEQEALGAALAHTHDQGR